MNFGRRAPERFSAIAAKIGFHPSIGRRFKGGRGKRWLDQLDIIPGASWDRSGAEDALISCSHMILILSPGLCEFLKRHERDFFRAG